MSANLLVLAGLLAIVPAQLAPPPQSSAVKLRLEIEIRGKLAVTDQSATITSKETVFEYVKNPQAGQPGAVDLMLQSKEVDKVWQLVLADNLKKTAKQLAGKEVILVGKCVVLGVGSQASSGKTSPTIGTRIIQQPRGGGAIEMPVIVLPEGIATQVVSHLLLDATVTAISIKAAN